MRLSIKDVHKIVNKSLQGGGVMNLKFHLLKSAFVCTKESLS